MAFYFYFYFVSCVARYLSLLRALARITALCVYTRGFAAYFAAVLRCITRAQQHCVALSSMSLFSIPLLLVCQPLACGRGVCWFWHGMAWANHLTPLPTYHKTADKQRASFCGLHGSLLPYCLCWVRPLPPPRSVILVSCCCWWTLGRTFSPYPFYYLPA